jgi:hypothetical protein
MLANVLEAVAMKNVLMAKGQRRALIQGSSLQMA